MLAEITKRNGAVHFYLQFLFVLPAGVHGLAFWFSGGMAGLKQVITATIFFFLLGKTCVISWTLQKETCTIFATIHTLLKGR